MWTLIISGKKDPFLNMEIDFNMWHSVREKKSFPILRFYQWDPPSVSLGYNQSPEKIVDTQFCKKNNIPIVKRPTGGSAIFHDIELTYSFASNICFSSSFYNPTSSYFSICEAIKKGIEKIGIQLEIRGFSDGKEPSFTNKACFTLSSKHDLVYKGKKIIGSAQRRDKYSFLQHGSILLSIRKNLWERIFIEKLDFEKISSLDEILKEKFKIEQLIECLKNGFEEFFGIKFERKET